MGFTEEQYHRYMEYVNNKLKEINQVIQAKKSFEWISTLSYDEWVKWQSNELKMYTPLKNSIEI